MLTARDNGELRGYLVQHMDGEDCTVDDLVAAEDSVGAALLAGATALAHQRGVQTLSAPWLSAHSGRQLLEKCGFRRRESSPIVLMTLQQAISGPTGPTTAEWYLTQGDWES